MIWKLGNISDFLGWPDLARFYLAGPVGGKREGVW